jgi:DNA-binding transcriptional LysR family regulator
MAVRLRQLRALITVIEEGTFTDAAIALGTSQASISRAVADLEKTLGIRLLQRTSAGALPTVAGRRVAEHARHILTEVAGIERVTVQASTELRIGFAWSVFGRLTTPIHRRWQATHPGQTLTFVQADTASVGLLEGETDIAVLRRSLYDDRFDKSFVGAESRVAAVASDDPLAQHDMLRLADLGRRPVATNKTTGTTTTDLWPPDATPVTREIHSTEEWLTLIAAGDAVGITSEATADQFPRPGVRYLPIRDAPPIAVWLAWWRDNPPAGAAAFRQLVCEMYSAK